MTDCHLAFATFSIVTLDLLLHQNLLTNHLTLKSKNSQSKIAVWIYVITDHQQTNQGLFYEINVLKIVFDTLINCPDEKHRSSIVVLFITFICFIVFDTLINCPDEKHRSSIFVLFITFIWMLKRTECGMLLYIRFSM